VVGYELLGIETSYDLTAPAAYSSVVATLGASS